MSTFGNHTRTLKRPEWRLAVEVFALSLPKYDQILITDGLGAGNRPWTEAITGFIHPLVRGSHRGGEWRLHLGKDGFANAMQMKNTLVHELAHVWQGYNSFFGDSYMFKSLYAQIKGDAYKYKLGKSWGDYNPEQQAQIVEDWYAAGMKRNDPRHVYMEKHIWAGRN